MQPAEEFMRDFFRARTAEIKKELENRAPFRQRFFTDDCFWDSRKGVIERNESETIVSVSNSGDKIQVITQQTNPFPRLRYHLQRTKQSWLIRCVEMECSSCREVSGNVECVFCNGTGWLGEKNQIERIKMLKCNIPPSRRQF